jgi:hypothetical protein
LAGWCADPGVKAPDNLIADGSAHVLAGQCYAMADAMLAERAKDE